MNIDARLLLAAKRHAVDVGVTMSDLVRNLLAREVGWSPGGEAAPIDEAAAAPILESYSGGEVTRRQAMEALGLSPDRQPEFVVLMNRLKIPWPSPDPKQVDEEAELVASAIQENGHED